MKNLFNKFKYFIKRYKKFKPTKRKVFGSLIIIISFMIFFYSFDIFLLQDTKVHINKIQLYNVVKNFRLFVNSAMEEIENTLNEHKNENIKTIYVNEHIIIFNNRNSKFINTDAEYSVVLNLNKGLSAIIDFSPVISELLSIPGIKTKITLNNKEKISNENSIPYKNISVPIFDKYCHLSIYLSLKEKYTIKNIAILVILFLFVFTTGSLSFYIFFKEKLEKIRYVNLKEKTIIDPKHLEILNSTLNSASNFSDILYDIIYKEKGINKSYDIAHIKEVSDEIVKISNAVKALREITTKYRNNNDIL